jgi:hypothetical protein
MPMASLTSLLFLVGGLSLQSLSLQERLQGENQRRLEQAEDRLASAAQMLVGTIQLQHACLLGLAHEQWSSAECATQQQLSRLAEGEMLGSPWRLRRWQPQVSPDLSHQVVDLELALPAGAGSPALVSGFAVRLTGSPLRVTTLLPLGPRGGKP